MAILTWQNVSAPSSGGMGGALGDVNAAFASAMEGLRVASDRARANRRAAYSTEALLGLTGVQNANDVGAYAQGLDSDMLTPEALAIIQAQPGLLLDRQVKTNQIRDMDADFTWQEDARAGELVGVQKALAARHLAGTTGDIQDMATLTQGADGHAQRTILENFGSVLDDRDTYTGYVKDVFEHNQAVTDYDTTNMARNLIQNNLRNSALTKNQAVHLLDKMPDLDPRVREKAQAQLSGMDDSFFQSQDILSPQSTLAANQSLQQQFSANQMSAKAVADTHEAYLNAQPENQYLGILDSMGSGGTGLVGQQLADKMVEMGVTSPGFDWDGINQDIERIYNKFVVEGKNNPNAVIPTRAEIAAAGVATARTSNIAFVDSLKSGNDDQIMKTIRSVREGGARESFVTDRETRLNEVNQLNEYTSQIQQFDQLAALAATRNMPSEQARIEAARDQLISEQSALLTSIRQRDSYNGESSENGESKADAPSQDKKADTPKPAASKPAPPKPAPQPVDPRAVLGLPPDPMAQPLPARTPEERLQKELDRNAQRHKLYGAENAKIADQVERMWLENEAAAAAGRPLPHRPMDIQALEERIR